MLPTEIRSKTAFDLCNRQCILFLQIQVRNVGLAMQAPRRYKLWANVGNTSVVSHSDDRMHYQALTVRQSL
jgi:hypothetical protein